MAQKKLFRFSEIKSFQNVLEYPTEMKGKWNNFFKNDNPIILELACGRGEYTIGLSQLYPDINVIGIDIKGNRMYIGAKKALADNLKNAAFLRTQIDKLTDYFDPGEVSEIWITFPDPQLRKSKAKKRLTHPKFLKLYQQILKPGGLIHLKTDSPQLFDFTKIVIDLLGLTKVSENNNIYASSEIEPALNIKTHYELMDIARSNRTHYLSFYLPNVLADKEEELKALLYESND